MVISGAIGSHRTANKARAAFVRANAWPPLPIVLVLLSLICPIELSVEIGGLRFPPHRFAFLLLLPLALTRLAARSDTQIRSFDWLLLLFATWQVAIYSYHEGQEGLIFGGSLALEILGGYAIARAYIRDVPTLLASLRFLLGIIALTACLAFLDTLTSRYAIHEVLRSLMGASPMGPADFRMGLIRAGSTFDHPIHYGSFCAAAFALLWCAEPRNARRLVRGAIVVFATFLSLSSAPLLSLGLQAVMLSWEYWTRGIAMRLHMTLAVLAGLYIGMTAVASRSPIQLLITGMTFDPWTGIYRTLIWEHGLTNVWASPWTGLGLAEWDRPQWMISSTIDAYWLVLAMRSGIPAFLLLAAAIILMVRAVLRRGTRSKDKQRRRLSSGWIISMIALCLLGATVHFWNVPHAMFFFFLGLGGILADPNRVKSRVPRPRAMSPLPYSPAYGAYGHAPLPA